MWRRAHTRRPLSFEKGLSGGTCWRLVEYLCTRLDLLADCHAAYSVDKMMSCGGGYLGKMWPSWSDHELNGASLVLGEEVSLAPVETKRVLHWELVQKDGKGPPPKLPEGLQLNPHSGVVSGIPTRESHEPTTVTLSASNGDGWPPATKTIHIPRIVKPVHPPHKGGGHRICQGGWPCAL